MPQRLTRPVPWFPSPSERMSRPSTRSLALLLAASTLAGALQTPSALLAHVQAACTPSGPPVCIIDGNNLRGAELSLHVRTGASVLYVRDTRISLLRAVRT